jgi:peptide/nickel transport system ATP-binding protein
VRFQGHDVGRLRSDPKLRAIGLSMQMIFQDPFSSLNPRQRVGALLSEPLGVHGLASGADARTNVETLLARVRMRASDADKLPHQFSGGQRQRICIARALAMRPTFLICDEPTSALDVSVQAQDDLGLTMLFISHDLAVIRQMCDRVAVMRAGQLCELDGTEALFEAPRHEYTRRLLSLMPRFAPEASA